METITRKQLTIADINWCFDFESKTETLRVLNIIGEALTEKGRRIKKELETWINKNSDKYLTLMGKS